MMIGYWSTLPAHSSMPRIVVPRRRPLIWQFPRTPKKSSSTMTARTGCTITWCVGLAQRPPTWMNSRRSPLSGLPTRNSIQFATPIPRPRPSWCRASRPAEIKRPASRSSRLSTLTPHYHRQMTPSRPGMRANGF